MSKLRIPLLASLTLTLACQGSMSAQDEPRGEADMPAHAPDLSSAPDASPSLWDMPPARADMAGADMAAPAQDMREDRDDMGECISDEAFFAQYVWTVALAPTCQNCHNPQGTARATAFVLEDPQSATGAMARNQLVVQALALQRVEGQGDTSLLLLKPTAAIAHGGGRVLQADSQGYAVLADFVQRAENPTACADEPTPQDFFEGTELLSPYATLRKGTLLLAGRLPTLAEVASVDARGEAALPELLDAIMSEDAFAARVGEGFNDVLLTNAQVEANAELMLNSEVYPQRDWFRDIQDAAKQKAARDATRYGLGAAPVKLVEHIIRQDLPITQLLSADYMMVNPMSARSYGIFEQLSWSDPQDPEEFQVARLAPTPDLGPVAYPHSGLLTDYTYWARYPSTVTNRNRARARVFYLHFLDTDLLALAPQAADPTAVADFANPVRDAEVCSVCHTLVDPVAGVFQNYRSNGQREPRPDGWYTDTFPPGFEQQLLPEARTQDASRWLADIAIADPRFARAMTAHAYRIVMGRDPYAPPEDASAPDFRGRLRAYEVQRDFLVTLQSELAQGGFDFKLLIKRLLLSPYFRASTMQQQPSPARKHELHDYGSSQLLTPEHLGRKLRAVFGQEWEITGKPALDGNSRFGLLYGGIDSLATTERLSEPNGMMGAIQRLMANDMSCRHTARDFALAPAQRLLFPHVELTDVPATSQAVIRQNLVHLHERLLGERVQPNSPEIDASYALFASVQADGAAGVSAGLAGYPARLERVCRSGNLIKDDESYTVRAWMAVLSYLMQTYDFLYE